MEHVGTTVAAPARPDRPRPAEDLRRNGGKQLWHLKDVPGKMNVQHVPTTMEI